MIPSRGRRSVALTLAVVAASYLACASAATYPVVTTFGSDLPGQLTDPLEHLWLMRWSKACLVEGRSPFFCPSLQAPTGVPLGNFPTLHVQTVAYLLLGLVTDNDVACFNAIWLAGFVATGLGTFVLGWWVVRKVGPAWLAGLGAMLCGPMLMHAHGHLETMQMGAVPLFLIGWIRFVDRPDRARLATAVGLYLLVVACAPYFAVLGVFPAVWYVVWSVFRQSGSRSVWIKGRIGWLVGFGALALPGVALLFSNQVWAAAHGFAMARSRAEFDHFGAPAWSSFVPSPLHPLGRVATPDLFASTGSSGRMIECSSYLGVITLAALAYSAMRRVRFPRAGYWWSLLVLMVVLSWGSDVDLGWARIKLPAGWIYGIFPPFHLIRVPARFNLFAAIGAAVPASAAIADVMGRIARPVPRALFVVACASMMLLDLSMVPFERSTIPPIPTIYRDLTYRNPGETLVDAPMFDASQGQIFSSLWAYWQSFHGARTSAGYPGLPNLTFDAEVVRASPFWGGRLLDPEYLTHPGPERFGPVEGVDPRDYAWLFLTVHRYDHVLVHQGTWTDPKYASGNERIKALLAEAKVFEDADVAAFDRTRLVPPTRLTCLGVEGFRPALLKSSPWAYGVLREARVAIFNPSPDRPMVLRLDDASAFVRRRVVRLLEGDREVASWVVEPGSGKILETRPFSLGGGIRELTLIADGDDQPARSADKLDEARTAYGWRIHSVRVLDASDR